MCATSRLNLILFTNAGMRTEVNLKSTTTYGFNVQTIISLIKFSGIRLTRPWLNCKVFQCERNTKTREFLTG